MEDKCGKIWKQLQKDTKNGEIKLNNGRKLQYDG